MGVSACCILKGVFMASFKIHGRFKICCKKSKGGGRRLVFDDFWSDDSTAHYLADKCGCYVFAIQTRRSLKPIYIGRATKTFRQETFNPNNKYKYQDGFSGYGVGTPVMFFVVHPNRKGKRNVKEIAQIEDFLIQTGVAVNPRLQNVRGAKGPKWSIQGVVRSGKGKRSEAESYFRRLFDLR
jgi:hypothetical protein